MLDREQRRKRVDLKAMHQRRCADLFQSLFRLLVRSVKDPCHVDQQVDPGATLADKRRRRLDMRFRTRVHANELQARPVLLFELDQRGYSFRLASAGKEDLDIGPVE